MSGIESVKSKYPYRVMSVYGSRKDEHTLKGGLRALTRGETSGHITTDEYFTDKALYEKYIKGTDIPCRIFKDKETGETVYQVHFSYGPANSDPTNPGSQLDPSEYYNSLNAHYLTRSDAMTVIDQQKKTVQSPLDLLGLTQRDILLSTQSIIRTTPENQAAVEKFQNNIQKALIVFLGTSGKDQYLEIYQAAFKREFEELRKAIAPNSTPDQFAHDFHKFGTIGVEPIETRELRLITKAQQDAGMQGSRIDLRLAKIRDIYDDSKKGEDYNLVLNNCSHKAADIETAGVSECKDYNIKKSFNLKPGINELNKQLKQLASFHPLTLEQVAGNFLLSMPIAIMSETPVNVLINADRLEHALKNDAEKTLSAEKTTKRSQSVAGLTPRLKNPHPHLSLHMSPVRNQSLRDLVEKAEAAKIVMKVSIDEGTKKLSRVVFYGRENKNLALATIEIKPNNAIDIQFGDLPLDKHQTKTLLHLLEKNIKTDKESLDGMTFAISFSEKSGAIEATTLERDIHEVFGKNIKVDIKQEPAKPQAKIEGP